MRLYKIEITQRPELVTPRNTEDRRIPEGYVESYPAGLEQEWVEHCEAMWGEFRSFFLPSETKVYRSRSSARDKQKIVERWGGRARILEAEVSEFIPSEDAKRKREIARLEERLEDLKWKDRVPF